MHTSHQSEILHSLIFNYLLSNKSVHASFPNPRIFPQSPQRTFGRLVPCFRATRSRLPPLVVPRLSRDLLLVKLGFLKRTCQDLRPPVPESLCQALRPPVPESLCSPCFSLLFSGVTTPSGSHPSAAGESSVPGRYTITVWLQNRPRKTIKIKSKRMVMNSNHRCFSVLNFQLLTRNFVSLQIS